MTDETLMRQIIAETVDATVSKLQAAGILRSGQCSAVEKTETLLYQYKALQDTQTPYARRVVGEINACLEEFKNDPYIDSIRLFYFDGLKNAAAAAAMHYDERTFRRNRRQLVEKFAVRLASEEFIEELLR